MAANKTRRRIRGRSHDRSGVAASEFAVILPILFIIIAGTVETYTTIQLRESALVAAYEGARGGISRHSTNSGVVAKCDQVLQDRGVVVGSGGNHVTISADVATVPKLQPFTVTVSVPTNGNTVLPFADRWFSWFGNRQVSASVTLLKEFSSAG